jgi:hypothetical protein
MAWEIVENPAFAGQEPHALGRATCHDGSPFITIACSCGFDMHLHETQIAAVPAGTVIATACKGCGDLLTFAPGQLEDAFAQMRADGWIE